MWGFGDLDPQTLPQVVPSINAVYTSDGYVVDVATGYSISICYDSNSQAYECTSGARILNIDYSALGGKPKTDYTYYYLAGGILLALLLVMGGKR